MKVTLDSSIGKEKYVKKIGAIFYHIYRLNDIAIF